MNSNIQQVKKAQKFLETYNQKPTEEEIKEQNYQISMDNKRTMYGIDKQTAKKLQTTSNFKHFLAKSPQQLPLQHAKKIVEQIKNDDSTNKTQKYFISHEKLQNKKVQKPQYETSAYMNVQRKIIREKQEIEQKELEKTLQEIFNPLKEASIKLRPMQRRGGVNRISSSSYDNKIQSLQEAIFPKKGAPLVLQEQLSSQQLKHQQEETFHHLNQRIKTKNSMCLFLNSEEYQKKLSQSQKYFFSQQQNYNQNNFTPYNYTAKNIDFEDQDNNFTLYEDIYQPNQFQMQNVIIEISRQIAYIFIGYDGKTKKIKKPKENKVQNQTDFLQNIDPTLVVTSKNNLKQEFNNNILDNNSNQQFQFKFQSKYFKSFVKYQQMKQKQKEEQEKIIKSKNNQLTINNFDENDQPMLLFSLPTFDMGKNNQKQEEQQKSQIQILIEQLNRYKFYWNLDPKKLIQDPKHFISHLIKNFKPLGEFFRKVDRLALNKQQKEEIKLNQSKLKMIISFKEKQKFQQNILNRKLGKTQQQNINRTVPVSMNNSLSRLDLEEEEDGDDSEQNNEYDDSNKNSKQKKIKIPKNVRIKQLHLEKNNKDLDEEDQEYLQLIYRRLNNCFQQLCTKEVSQYIENNQKLFYQFCIDQNIENQSQQQLFRDHSYNVQMNRKLINSETNSQVQNICEEQYIYFSNYYSDFDEMCVFQEKYGKLAKIGFNQKMYQSEDIDSALRKRKKKKTDNKQNTNNNSSIVVSDENSQIDSEEDEGEEGDSEGNDIEEKDENKSNSNRNINQNTKKKQRKTEKLQSRVLKILKQTNNLEYYNKDLELRKKLSKGILTDEEAMLFSKTPNNNYNSRVLVRQRQNQNLAIKLNEIEEQQQILARKSISLLNSPSPTKKRFSCIALDSGNNTNTNQNSNKNNNSSQRNLRTKASTLVPQTFQQYLQIHNLQNPSVQNGDMDQVENNNNIIEENEEQKENLQEKEEQKSNKQYFFSKKLSNKNGYHRKSKTMNLTVQPIQENINNNQEQNQKNKKQSSDLTTPIQIKIPVPSSQNNKKPQKNINLSASSKKLADSNNNKNTKNQLGKSTTSTTISFQQQSNQQNKLLQQQQQSLFATPIRSAAFHKATINNTYQQQQQQHQSYQSLQQSHQNSLHQSQDSSEKKQNHHGHRDFLAYKSCIFQPIRSSQNDFYNHRKSISFQPQQLHSLQQQLQQDNNFPSETSINNHNNSNTQNYNIVTKPKTANSINNNAKNSHFSTCNSSQLLKNTQQQIQKDKNNSDISETISEKSQASILTPSSQQQQSSCRSSLSIQESKISVDIASENGIKNFLQNQQMQQGDNNNKNQVQNMYKTTPQFNSNNNQNQQQNDNSDQQKNNNGLEKLHSYYFSRSNSKGFNNSQNTSFNNNSNKKSQNNSSIMRCKSMNTSKINQLSLNKKYRDDLQNINFSNKNLKNTAELANKFCELIYEDHEKLKLETVDQKNLINKQFAQIKNDFFQKWQNQLLDTNGKLDQSLKKQLMEQESSKYFNENFGFQQNSVDALKLQQNIFRLFQKSSKNISSHNKH